MSREAPPPTGLVRRDGTPLPTPGDAWQWMTSSVAFAVEQIHRRVDGLSWRVRGRWRKRQGNLEVTCRHDGDARRAAVLLVQLLEAAYGPQDPREYVLEP